MLYEHITSYIKSLLLASERDTIRGNKWKSEIYIWYVQDTLIARTRCYVMQEELSVSHFYNVVTIGNEH